MLIEALVSVLAVEAFDERVLNRLSRLDEAELDAAIGRPCVSGTASKFTAVVQRQTHGLAA